MPKRLSVYGAILLSFVFVLLGYSRLERWKFRQEVLKELGPFLADEEEQKRALLAMGEVDLDPSGLTLAKMEQQLKKSALKRPGDFNSTRLGWACGKERCAIWATFLVPIGQDIPLDTQPAGLIIKSPALGDFQNIRIREIRLGQSDQKLVESFGGGGQRSPKIFRRISWDKNWTAAWTGLDGKAKSCVAKKARDS